MIAKWKIATQELPERRIRVLVCDTRGYMQTAFYGISSYDIDANNEHWYSDSLDEPKLNSNDIMFWDYFPDNPFPKKEWWDV